MGPMAFLLWHIMKCNNTWDVVVMYADGEQSIQQLCGRVGLQAPTALKQKTNQF